MTLTRREVVGLLEREGRRPRRGLGQNFVVDPNTVRAVARLSGVGPGDRVLEIGAGLGSLTLALAETSAQVTAVEVDPHLVALLREVLSNAEVEGIDIVEADAMTLDIGALLGPGPVTLVANLPYNVASPLIADLLDDVPAITSMLVMVQREAGERLAASPGSPAYGGLSVKVSYWATARVVRAVSRNAFYPRPNVDSVLVAIERRVVPAVDPAEVDAASMFALVRAGFGQRRKMLRRALVGLVEPEDFAAAGVRPEARAEELDVEAWGRLAAVTRE